MTRPDETTSTPVAWRDGRAERIRAAAEAEQARAAAEATRAETAQRSERARAQLAAERSEQRAAAAARRRAAVRAGARAVLAELPSVAGFVACVAPTLIATRGQLEFARTQMQLGSMSVLLPAMLEGAAWLLAWRRHQAVTAGEPAGRLTTGVWLLAAVAASLNLWHGATGPGGLQVGVAYALASLVGFALVELLVGHQRRARAAADQARRPRALLIGLARLLRYPLLSWAAWSRRVELGPGADAAQAWGQAWRDRFGVELGADAITRRRGRTRARAARRAAGAAAEGDPASWGNSAASPDQQDEHGHTLDAGAAEDHWSLSEPGEMPGGERRPLHDLPDDGGDDATAESGAQPSGSADARVQELAELVEAGCPVTGEQAGAMYAVSSRTGRRLLARAQTLLNESGRDPEPPDDPGPGTAAHHPTPLTLVAAPTELGVGA